MRSLRGIASEEALGSPALAFSGTPPSLVSIDNDVGDTDGPHAGLMTLTGTDFSASGLAVTVGGTAALDVTYVNSTTVTCRPPAKAAGQHDVEITTDFGSDTLVNGYRAWNPGLISSASVDGYFDSRRDVTGTAPVTGWENQADAEVFDVVGGDTDLVADYFGTGVPALYFDGTGGLKKASGRYAQATGYSRFWVGEHTETALAPAPYNPKLTAIGETLGSVYNGAGMRAGMLDLSQYVSSWHTQTRASRLNDGATRLMGFTHTGTSAKAYVDGTQVGEDMRLDAYSNAPYSIYNGWNALGAGYNGGADYLIGHYGAFVSCSGVIDATDRTLLTKWARLSFGTAAKPAVSALDFSPRVAWVQGNYVNAGTGTWPGRTVPPVFGYTDSAGDAVETGSPGPTEVGGAPDAEVSTDYKLASGVELGDCFQSDGHEILAACSFESITATSSDRWTNHAFCSDVSGYSCLFAWKNGADFFVGIYCWDTAQRFAEVDVTALLGVAGDGDLIIQGKREGGTLYVRARAGDGTGDTGWVSGDASGVPGATVSDIHAIGGAGQIPDGVVRCSMQWNYPLPTSESDASIAWAETLFP
jgi:hypothetical protein